ncbi:hypothetical protein LCGC14_0626060 [marine sediment metagenome]|uniref:Uncharacterized protein n=1 Tax=marine sediment metagenome TaxID=412755 RepID=A0A0F9TPR6_9ZZZZ
MWAIIAAWDAQNHVTRYNYVVIEAEAIRLVDRLHGEVPSQSRLDEMQSIIDNPQGTVGMKAWAHRELLPLSITKQAPNAYYAELTTDDPDCVDSLHQAGMWDCDPANMTVVFSSERLATKFRGNLVDAVKSESYRLIDEIAPDWKQRNTLQRYGELSIIENAALTTEEGNELVQIGKLWDQIRDIRSKSNRLERRIGLLSLRELRALVIHDEMS